MGGDREQLIFYFFASSSFVMVRHYRRQHHLLKYWLDLRSVAEDYGLEDGADELYLLRVVRMSSEWPLGEEKNWNNRATESMGGN